MKLAILVVEDEAARAMSVMEIAPDGTLVENAANDVKVTRAFGRKLRCRIGLNRIRVRLCREANDDRWAHRRILSHRL